MDINLLINPASIAGGTRNALNLLQSCKLRHYQKLSLTGEYGLKLLITKVYAQVVSDQSNWPYNV